MRLKKDEVFHPVAYGYSISNHCRIINSKEKILKGVPKKLVDMYNLKTSMSDVEKRSFIANVNMIEVIFTPKESKPFYRRGSGGGSPWDKYRARDAKRKAKRDEWRGLTQEQKRQRNLMSD